MLRIRRLIHGIRLIRSHAFSMPMSVHNYAALIAGNYNAHDIDDRIARSA